MARTAGIREARQHLSRLIAEVRQGREIEITDRGKVVARLVPPAPRSGRGLPDLARFRRTMARGIRPEANLGAALDDERDDRL